MNEQAMTIGAFAAAVGIGVETLRFYQRRGLLRQPARPQGSVRRYGKADLQRLAFIKSAKRLGFSLAEILELLALQEGPVCSQGRAVAQARLGDVRDKLADLRRMETELVAMVESCDSAGETTPCPVLVALQAPTAAVPAPI